MANTAQTRKRARTNEKRRLLISPMRARMRTLIKQLTASLDGGKLEDAQNQFKTVASTLDRLARKNVIHKNRAARLKSRLNKRIKALAGK